jgi:hypothetical protein
LHHALIRLEAMYGKLDKTLVLETR